MTLVWFRCQFWYAAVTNNFQCLHNQGILELNGKPYVTTISKVHGEVNLPGSKSVSNRALLLAALAQGTTRLTNLLDSDDIRHMLNALTSSEEYTLSQDKTGAKLKVEASHSTPKTY